MLHSMPFYGIILEIWYGFREPHAFSFLEFFITNELKGILTYLSLKKSSDPEKTILALFLACCPPIRRVLLPTACGYCNGKE